MVDDSLLPKSIVENSAHRSSRRGRKRKNSKSRFPGGKIRPDVQDQIPQGLAARRIAILELEDSPHEIRAGSPPGVCQARGLILKVELRVADLFEAAHRRQAERAKPPASCLANTIPSGEGAIALPTDPGSDASGEADYLRHREALKAAGSRPLRMVMNTAIHHLWPRFLDTERTRPPAAWLADARDLGAFRKGLEALRRSMAIDADDKDDFTHLIRDIERRLNPTWEVGRIISEDSMAEPWRKPTDDQIAWALLHDSVAGVVARRERRLPPGEPEMYPLSPTIDPKIAALSAARLARAAEV
jgi:hypothetical protein